MDAPTTNPANQPLRLDTALERADSQAIPAVRGRWRTVSALSAAIFVDNLENFTIQILWPFMYPVLGFSVGQLGFVTGITSIFKTITSPLWGFLADRYSRKWLLVAVTGLWGLWTGAIGLIDTFPQLLLIRALSSLGLAAFWPIVTSLLSDLFPSTERGKATGIMNAIGYVGNLLSFIILPVLAGVNPEAWRWGFMVLGGLSFLSGLILLLVVDPPRGSAERELADVVGKDPAAQPVMNWSDVPRLLRLRSWWLLMFNFVLNNAPINILGTFTFTWMVGLQFGSIINAILPLQALGIIAGHLLFGWLGDRSEQRGGSQGRYWLGQVLMFVHVIVLFGFLYLGAQSVVLLAIFSLLTAVVTGAVESGVRTPMVQNVLPPDLRGTGRALIEMVLGIVLGTTVSLFGYAVDRFGMGLTTMLLLVIPTTKLVCALAFLPLKKTYAEDVAQMHAGLQEQRQALIRQASTARTDD